jgi:hypothetical protein
VSVPGCRTRLPEPLVMSLLVHYVGAQRSSTQRQMRPAISEVVWFNPVVVDGSGVRHRHPSRSGQPRRPRAEFPPDTPVAGSVPPPPAAVVGVVGSTLVGGVGEGSVVAGARTSTR